MEQNGEIGCRSPPICNQLFLSLAAPLKKFIEFRSLLLAILCTRTNRRTKRITFSAEIKKAEMEPGQDF